MFAVYGETVLCAGQKVDGWTGYTWETNLFPNPANFLGSIKEVFTHTPAHLCPMGKKNEELTRTLTWAQLYGLHVTNNMHPAAGVQCTEKNYPEMARGTPPPFAGCPKVDKHSKTYYIFFLILESHGR